MMIPDGEYERFKSHVKAESSRYGLTLDDYLKKVWYHELRKRIKPRSVTLSELHQAVRSSLLFGF